MDVITAKDVFKADFLNLNKSDLYENAPCGHICFNPAGFIVSLNQTLANWMGITDKEEIYKKKFSDILSKAGKFYYQMIVLPLLNMQGAVNEINFDITSGGSASFPCLFSAVTISAADDKVKIIHATIIKITDRKKYESELLNEKKFANEEKKRFEFLANIIPNILFTATRNGKVNFMNERFYEYFNLSKTEVQQNSFLQLIFPAERIKAAKLWTKCFKDGTGFDAEVRLRKDGGKYEWFLIRILPYRDDSGNYVTWFGSCTNIQEHKEKQRFEVDQLNDSLFTASGIIIKKEETLKEIAFDQSHLIRMPLSNILGLISIMEATLLDDDAQHLLALLKQSSVQLDTVIRKIVNKTYNGSE